ncbi:MAG TPA: hypothetical protein VGC21_06905 [Telluria sp.]|jgi:hypothetical protein
MHPSATLLPLCLLIALPAAYATTTAEDDMNKALMPHATLATSGAKVLVHRARLQGTPGANGLWKKAADELRRAVQSCVANLGANKVPVKPPKVFPEYSISLREDIYAAANRSIKYTHTLGYSLNAADCSLIETKQARAELVSDAGTCDIDLDLKTASGVCDARAHASAPAVRPFTPNAQQQAQAAAMPAEMRAMLKNMEAKQAGTGAKKTILGLSCDVLPVMGTDTMCVATGGSFSLKPGAGAGVMRVLPLDYAVGGFALRAVDARLDDSVSASVFTPHLAGGFTITKDAP